MDKLRIKQTITKKEMIEAIMLDDYSYNNESFKGSLELCSSWYKKNNKIYTLVKDDKKLIGYINFMPLTKKCYSRYKQGKFHDSEITADDIETYEIGKTYDCLFCSVVIDKSYRDSLVVLYLLKGFLKKVKTLLRQGIKINNILADCVSKSVEKFIQNLGFSFVRENSLGAQLYECKLKDIKGITEYAR